MQGSTGKSRWWVPRWKGGGENNFQTPPSWTKNIINENEIKNVDF